MKASTINEWIARQAYYTTLKSGIIIKFVIPSQLDLIRSGILTKEIYELSQKIAKENKAKDEIVSDMSYEQFGSMIKTMELYAIGAVIEPKLDENSIKSISEKDLMEIYAILQSDIEKLIEEGKVKRAEEVEIKEADAVNPTL